MILTEIEQEAKALTRSEKIELIHFLSNELLKDERLNYFSLEETHAMWSQFDAHEAAAALQTLLDKRPTAQRFPYTVMKGFSGLKSGLPLIPITLSHEDHVVKVPGLVDSGSTVSVLPYDVGLQLGLDWDRQDLPAPLRGMLNDVPSYGILVTGTLNPFPAVPLVFAWAQSNETPVILGQQNFFKEYV